ncbi:MAG: hypothetical protein ACOYXR_03360 [Nitrospirota bacterium]
MENKVKCNKCGAKIREATFQKTGGVCMPCYKEDDPVHQSKTRADMVTGTLGVLIMVPIGTVTLGAVILWIDYHSVALSTEFLPFRAAALLLAIPTDFVRTVLGIPLSGILGLWVYELAVGGLIFAGVTVLVNVLSMNQKTKEDREKRMNRDQSQ